MATTITIPCNLRKLLRIAADESAVINRAVQMGLLRLLDRLSCLSERVDDSEIRDLLNILCLVDDTEHPTR
jgi:hypothetical protein